MVLLECHDRMAVLESHHDDEDTIRAMNDSTNEDNGSISSVYESEFPTFERIHQRLLNHDMTLTLIDLTCNDIEDEELKLLATSLETNQHVKKLVVAYNLISDDGATSLAECLTVNTTLLELHLNGNQIGNVGAMALASAFHTNETLTYITMEQNPLTTEGEVELLECLHHNATLTDLWLYQTPSIQHEIRFLTYWNQIGGLYNEKCIHKLSISCQNRVVKLGLILGQLPICDDLHWMILNMLKVKDVVKSGNPWNDIETWT